jgi:hypothetical protein
LVIRKDDYQGRFSKGRYCAYSTRDIISKEVVKEQARNALLIGAQSLPNKKIHLGQT